MKSYKIIPIITFLSLLFTTVFTQNNAFQVQISNKTVGKNIINNQNIEGFEYVFPDRIESFIIDSVTQLLTVQLRGNKKGGGVLDKTGNVIQYSLKNKEVVWSKSVDFETFELLKFGNLLVFNDYSRSMGIDAYTGKELWKVASYIYFANPEKNIGIAYRYIPKKGYTNELIGVDLLSNTYDWSREIKREYGWNDHFYLNDSTLLVVAAGLHTINLNTGAGWDYNTTTGKKISSSTSNDAFMVGVMFGLVGALIYSAVANYDAVTTSIDVIRDLVSNPLIDNSFVYFASYDQIAMLDLETGEKVWNATFKKNLVSKSTLFSNDSVVYMINHGVAYRNKEQINYGKAFFAAFDKYSGKNKYLSFLKTDKLIDYKISDDAVLFLCSNQIIKYDLATGTRIVNKVYPKESLNELNGFVDENMWIESRNGEFICLHSAHPLNMLVNTNQWKIFAIDNQLKNTQTIYYKDLFRCFYSNDKIKLLSKKNKTYIIDHKGVKIAELDVSPNAFIIDDVLYDKQNKSFIAIDLKNF